MLNAPAFSSLSASQSDTYGATAITLAGNLSFSSTYPAPGDTITVTINGNAQTTTINDATGDFSFTYNPSTIPASGTAYTITYSYIGNRSIPIGPAVDTSTTLTVNPKALTAQGTLSISSKVYDGTTNATPSGAAALQTAEAIGTGSSSDGVPYTADSVSLTGTATYAYNSPNVPTATTVTESGLSLTGAGHSNYTLTAPTLSASITQASTTVAVASSSNPVLPGSNVTFTATVSVVSPGAGTPTGNVTFLDGMATLGTGELNNSDVATFTTNSLSHGSHVITAAYPGDSNFVGSTNTLSPNQVIDTPPAAGAQYLGATVNTTLSVSASALAALNYDADGDPLTITAVNSPSTNGATVSLGGGNITYTPVANFVGSDVFTYTISDGYPGGTNTCTANVTVRLAKATAVFNSITSPASGTINLRGYGIPGNSYDVQESSDMQSWTTLATVTAADSGVILYTDTNANTSPRYYRFAVH